MDPCSARFSASSRCSAITLSSLICLTGLLAGCGQQVALPDAAPQRIEQLRQQWARETARPATPLEGVQQRRAAAPLGPSQWGNLTARFVYDGDPPPRKAPTITADQEFCGRHDLLLENLVVHPENRGVASIIVWLYLPRGDPLPPVHDTYLQTQDSEVVLDANLCRFEPHVCLLRTTQTLLIRNLNPIGDSAKIDTFDNPPISIMLSSGDEYRCRLPKPERWPIHVSCSVHPWESAWLLVKDHPYMAVSDLDGRVELNHLPAGNWSFQFWHERAGYITEANLDGQPARWSRGRTELHIEPGDNDLGEIVLPASLFDK
jgi:hypothetical protein